MKPSYIKGHIRFTLYSHTKFFVRENFANAPVGKSYETASFHSQRRNRSHVFARAAPLSDLRFI